MYYETESGKYERNVSLETIIPSIFRSYLENYKIVFENLQSPIYKIKNKNGDLVEKRTLDLETNQNTDNPNVVLANNDQKSEFIRGVLYLGVYYQNDDPNQPDVNKTEKRVITYKYNS